MKKLILTYSASLLLIVVLWFLFLISPLTIKRQEIKASYSEALSKLEDFRITMIEFPEHFANQKEMEKKKELIMSQLFSKEDLLRLFGALQKKASDFNLVLLEITPSIEELLAMNSQALQNNLPRPLDITVKLNGRFSDIGEYVKSVEAEKFFHGMDFCKISSTSEGHASPSIDFGFKVILEGADKI